MKIADTVATADTNSAFTIAATGKAFKILSDGLYSDKIRAVIRELACNARDSHVAAGNTAPWHMHLPTQDECWFSIEDFGTGMSHDDVMNVYSRYFASTKTASNDFVGQLGLGSKSPFSFTRSFTVNSRYGGVENRYRMYFDDSDTPRVDHIASGPANGTGIKVQFAVVSGFERWHSKAIDVLRWFAQPPSCNTELALENPEAYYEGQGWQIWNKHFWHGSNLQILMGGVLYPLDIHSIPDLDSKLYHLTDFPMVIDMPIGDCDVAASREGLSYDVRTVVNLRARLDAVRSDIIAMVSTAISSAANEWTARQLWNGYFTGSLGYAMRRMLEGTTLECQGVIINHGSIAVEAQKLYGMTDHGVRLMPAGIRSVRKHDSFMIGCAPNTKIVFDDIKKGGLARARQLHADSEHKNVTVMFPKASGSWESLRHQLGDPEVIYTSMLPEPSKKTRQALTQAWEFNGNRSGGKWSWKPVDPKTLPDKGKLLYVTLKGWDASTGHRALGRYGLDSLRSAAISTNLLKAEDRIYAVRASSASKLDHKRWVSLHDYLEPQAQKMFNEPKIVQLYISHAEQAYLSGLVPMAMTRLLNYVGQLRLGVRDPESELVSFLESYSQLKQMSGVDLGQYKVLQHHFDISMPSQTERSQLTIDAQRVVDKYAMIKHLNISYSSDHRVVDDVIRYIDAVDTSYVFNMLSKGESETAE